MILPPWVVEVLNHASVVNTLGASAMVPDTIRPLVVPLKVDAVLASPTMAPAAPRVTPVPTVALSNPAQSVTVVPELSPSRQ